MKSFALFALSSLAIFAAATPDHIQTVLCTDAPIQTVTVTAPCAPGQTPVTGGGSGSGSGSPSSGSGWGGNPGSGPSGSGNGGVVTVTVTATQTITSIITETGSATTSANGVKQTHWIDVGAFTVEGSNKTVNQYRPNNITANVGDVVMFNMLKMAHSVTQSQFPLPCIKNGTFDTGLVPNPMNISGSHVIPFAVTSTKPTWFYCQQKGHCGQGMVFGINPKSQEQMQQFIDMAIAQNGTSTNGTTTSPNNGTTTGSAPVATVTVGLNGGKTLTFSPPFLPVVAAGSTVRFEFHALNHSLTESSFDAPCSKLAGPGAIDTGFNQVNKNDVAPFTTFDLQVTSSTPRWFYCAQTLKNGTVLPKSHCEQGMVFGINTSEDKFDVFRGRAEGSAGPAAMVMKGMSGGASVVKRSVVKMW